jgi:hypothetical protein
MPNWCTNDIVITGEGVKTIKDILESCDKRGSFFISLLGQKPDDIETYKEYLGSKWDIPLAELNEEWDLQDDMISFHCGTAWSPPIQGLSRVCQKYNVECHIKYSEGGNDFAGQSNITNDGNVDDEEYPYLEGLYKLDNEEFWYQVDDNMEFYIEEHETLDKIKSNLFHFLNDSDRTELDTIYEDTMKLMGA